MLYISHISLQREYELVCLYKMCSEVEKAKLEKEEALKAELGSFSDQSLCPGSLVALPKAGGKDAHLAAKEALAAAANVLRKNATAFRESGNNLAAKEADKAADAADDAAAKATEAAALAAAAAATAIFNADAGTSDGGPPAPPPGGSAGAGDGGGGPPPPPPGGSAGDGDGSPPAPPPGGSAGAGDGGGGGGSADTWLCSKCFASNDFKEATCQGCRSKGWFCPVVHLHESQKPVRNAASDKCCIACEQPKPQTSRHRKPWMCRCCGIKNDKLSDNCKGCSDSKQGFQESQWSCQVCNQFVPSCQISCMYCKSLYWICNNFTDHGTEDYVRNPINSICRATSCSSQRYQRSCQQCTKIFTSPDSGVACSDRCARELGARGHGAVNVIDGQKTRSQCVMPPSFYSEATHALKNTGSGKKHMMFLQIADTALCL